MDALAFRQVLGAYPTGVTVVTTRDGAGNAYGLTVNSFSSVSLNPPLVLVCIDKGTSSHDRLIESGSFAVSILAVGQDGVASRFAADPAELRFQEVSCREGPTGDPLVEGAAAWIACRIEAVHPGGDHSILVGRVVELGLGEGDAIVFYRGAFRSLGRP